MPQPRKRVLVACAHCGAQIERQPARLAMSANHYCGRECARAARTAHVTAAFWIRGKRTQSGCLEWVGSTRSGYGVASYNGAEGKAHRIAYELTHGPIPDGLHVLHKCDNPPCYEPSHLFLGTHADNMADMSAKRRGAKLTAEQVAAILKTDGPSEKVGRMFGVSGRAVRYIRADSAFSRDELAA